MLDILFSRPSFKLIGLTAFILSTARNAIEKIFWKKNIIIMFVFARNQKSLEFNLRFLIILISRLYKPVL